MRDAVEKEEAEIKHWKIYQEHSGGSGFIQIRPGLRLFLLENKIY
jgi:hypothetical protein